MRVAEDDRARPWKPGAEVLEAPVRGAAVVDDRDLGSPDLDGPLGGQPAAKLGRVHVPVDADDRRSERPEVVEHLGAYEVAGMDDEVRRADHLEAPRRQPACSARHVGVGDDGDQEGGAGHGVQYEGMEDPMRVTRSVRIPLAEIETRASRSSGPGGQHANVTASRVEAVFDVRDSRALTPVQKERLAGRLGERVSAVAQDARSQARNRELALERLRERIAAGLAVPRRRRPTQPTAEARARRLAAKRRASARKRERRPPVPDDD
jgi:ribosome-associated protein